MKRRVKYEPMGDGDRFIVLLLKEEILGLIHKNQAFLKGKKILDVGCGNQPFRANYEALEGQYVSMDVVENDRTKVDFLQAIDAPLSQRLLGEKGFDWIHCTEVLEHVLDWQQSFSNFNQLLKQDGMVMITCPFFFGLHEEPHDYWRPTKYAMTKIAEQYGFEIVYQKEVGNGMDALGTLLGSSYFIPSKKSGFFRIFSRFLNFLKTRFIRMIASDFLRNRITMGGNYYLSNVLLLRKKG